MLLIFMKEIKMANKYIIAHLEALEEYINVQKDLIKVLQERPTDEFAMNSHYVKMRELEVSYQKVSDKLGKTVRGLNEIDS